MMPLGPFDSAPRELAAPALPPSLWTATAEPGPECPPLAEKVRCRVAVVGGGISGLSTALHLAKRGIEVAVLEANEVGWGASGRNGGQVIPGLKSNPDALVYRFGPDLGPRLVAAVGGAADLVFELITHHGIRCDAVQKGWIQPARCAAALALCRDRFRQWEAYGAPVEELDRAQVTEMVGSRAFVGGWIDHRAGGLHPLSYARGLASAVLGLGGRIFAGTRVQGLAPSGDGGWQLSSVGGTLEAEAVVLATNGHTQGLWPSLARTIIPLYSFQIATEPLPEAVRKAILPGGQVASDARRLLNYFMIDRDGRLLMGGRGPFRDRPDWVDADSLRDDIRRLFPEAAKASLAYLWAGRIAMTTSHLPHIHTLAPGLYAGLGFNGRGVAMATLFGRWLAHLAAGGEPEEIPLPLTAARPLALHALHRPVVTGLIGLNRLRDWWEERAS